MSDQEKQQVNELVDIVDRLNAVAPGASTDWGFATRVYVQGVQDGIEAAKLAAKKGEDKGEDDD